MRIWAVVELTLASGLLGAIIALVAFQIVARSFFGAPLTWAEEAGTAMFIWTVFLGASVAVKVDRHVKITALDALLPSAGSTALLQLGRVLIVVSMIWVAWLAWPFVAVESRSTSVSLPIVLPKSVYFSVPLIASALSMALTAILLIARDLTSGSEGDALARQLLGELADETGKS